jgi:hypothetical protein
MQTAFIIYIRAVGIYLIMTLPVIIAPFMYIISAMYVLMYGWFAWALFTAIYLCTRHIKTYEYRMLLLWAGVIPSVAFAFHMLGLFNPDLDVWRSSVYMAFPAVAVGAGWLSLNLSGKAVRDECRNKLEVQETENIN